MDLLLENGCGPRTDAGSRGRGRAAPRPDRSRGGQNGGAYFSISLICKPPLHDCFVASRSARMPQRLVP